MKIMIHVYHAKIKNLSFYKIYGHIIFILAYFLNDIDLRSNIVFENVLQVNINKNKN